MLVHVHQVLRYQAVVAVLVYDLSGRPVDENLSELLVQLESLELGLSLGLRLVLGKDVLDLVGLDFGLVDDEEAAGAEGLSLEIAVKNGITKALRYLHRLWSTLVILRPLLLRQRSASVRLHHFALRDEHLWLGALRLLVLAQLLPGFLEILHLLWLALAVPLVRVDHCLPQPVGLTDSRPLLLAILLRLVLLL